MNLHFSPVFDRIQTPVQIEKRERHALIPRRRRRRRRHTRRHTRPGCCCCCLFLGCSHLYSSPVVWYDIVTVVVIIMSLLHVRFYSSALINYNFSFFFSFLFVCPHKSTHTKEGGGGPLDSREVGLKKEPKEKERDFVLIKCVCVFRSFFFLCIPSFLCHERGCWQHHHHSSLNKVCIYYTLFLSSSRRQRILLLLKGTYDATAPDRSFATSSFTSSFTSSSVFVFIESGKNADFSDWKD